MRYFSFYYWIGMVAVVSLIFIDILGSYSASLLMAVMMLPGILTAKILWKEVSFDTAKTAIEQLTYLILIVLIIEFYSIISVYYFLFQTETQKAPEILLNPFFIWFIIGSLLSIESLVKLKLCKAPQREKTIKFISNRTRVSMETERLSYIESNDTEVTVNTISGEVYVSKMKISQWENILDDRFIRVHRSFIVNKGCIHAIESDRIFLGATEIPVSRKYKEAVKQL